MRSKYIPDFGTFSEIYYCFPQQAKNMVSKALEEMLKRQGGSYGLWSIFNSPWKFSMVLTQSAGKDGTTN